MKEVEAIIRTLPHAVRVKAQSLPVLFEKCPGTSLIADGIEADTLGLFEGSSLRDSEGGASLPPHIILFLDNIRESTEPDEALYRKEIRTTYLHELGHYLGLEEDDMESRSLG